MYEWLEHELAAVKTPKFFIVTTASSNDSSDGREFEEFPVSYAAYMRKFGESKFFRDSTGCYTIGIYAGPEKQEQEDGTYWEVGWHDDSSVLLKKADEQPERVEWAVLEKIASGRLKPVAESFEKWLRYRWNTAKKDFGRKEWQKIVRGPDPFTPEELKIIEARRKFQWRLLGIDDNCVMRFEIVNGSDRRLPYLGIRVHGKKRGMWVSIALRVDHVLPDTSAIVEYDRFRDMLAPDEIEVFEEPDPTPEDREFYWEFRPLPD